MELMKETSLNFSISNQVFMMLLMGGSTPTNAAELAAAVRVNDFTDMWNKSLGVCYAEAANASFTGSPSDATALFSPRSATGQLKGASLRLDAGTPAPTAGTGTPAVPDTIELETSTGTKIQDSGWLGLFLAQIACRSTAYNVKGNSALSPNKISEYASGPAYIVFGFKSARTFTGIQTHGSGHAPTMAVDYWDGAKWVECVSSRATPGSQIQFASAVTTDKMRLRLTHVGDEIMYGYYFVEQTVPTPAPVPNITWALLIPIGARPAGGSGTPFTAIIGSAIKRGGSVPFYALSVAGPGGNAEVILTKASGLQSSDAPQVTGFYIQPGNLIEV